MDLIDMKLPMFAIGFAGGMLPTPPIQYQPFLCLRKTHLFNSRFPLSSQGDTPLCGRQILRYHNAFSFTRHLVHPAVLSKDIKASPTYRYRSKITTIHTLLRNNRRIFYNQGISVAGPIPEHM
jgi:hypothetical protein